VLLPFAALKYVLLWTPDVGLVGLDWLWLDLAVVLDLGNVGGAGYANRGRVPTYRRA
jgi:hypothetical protein